ncbi:MAG TPA: hypothetical protein VGF22_19685, partial [Acidimicrobiales bacterium]
MTAASTAHLVDRLADLRQRVLAAMAVRRANDPSADDRFRGLYITDEQAPGLLDDRPVLAGRLDVDPEIERKADAAERTGVTLNLRCVARAFGLDAVDAEILLVAAAPDLDPRFEKAYGYLHDDVTRRRASIGLALELCGASLLTAADRERLAPDGRLVRFGLVVVEELDRPVLTRSLRVPDVVL